MYKNKLFIIALIIITSLSSINNSNAQNKTSKKPKNIIFLIGDGMATAQIYAALTIKKDKLNIARCRYIGFHKSYSASDYITDSAAGGTAFSTGQKTKNGCLAVDSMLHAFPTILELAEKRGLSTGLVSACAVTHATPASFIAHVGKRDNYEEIANWYLKTDIDVFIGGGRNYFNQRQDKVNLLDSLKAKNYQIIDTIAQLSKANSNGKIAGLLYSNHPPKMSEGRGDMLGESSKKAISVLEKNKKGFFVMIEGSQIDWGGHDNNQEYVITEMLDFDKVVGLMLDFAQKNGETLVVITGDHETGGLSLTGGNWNEGKFTAKFSTTDHSAVMVPIFAFGPGAEEFMGFMENTDIFNKFKKLIIDK
jgi:alkaline phosphatase